MSKKNRRKKPTRIQVDPNSRFTEYETIILVKKTLALENRISQLNNHITQLTDAIKNANFIVVPTGNNQISLIPEKVLPPKELDPTTKPDPKVP